MNIKTKISNAAAELGRKGGNSLLKKRGRKYMKKLAAMGGEVMRKRFQNG